MATKIQVRRGLTKDLPTLDNGELGLAEDNKTLYIGSPTGNIQLAKQEDLVKTNEQLAEKATKRYLFTNVKDFGAKGDGTTNDTVSIQNAINAVPYGGTLYFPAGMYLVSGYGSEIFLINKIMNIVGESATTGLLIKNDVPTTTDVFRVSIEGEARFITLEQFIILPQSGNPARYGIHLDVTNPTNKLANLLIRRVRIEQLGSKCIKLTNPNGDGFFTSQIEKCFLVGGIELERCGDSVLIHENTIAGNGIGIDISTVDGSIEQSISYNNITSTGESIRVKSGNHINILFNNIEQVYDYTGSSEAMIDIVGSIGNHVIGTKIIGNSLNGNVANVKPTHLIKVNYAEDTVIEHNNLQKGLGTSIQITSNAKDTKIGSQRWGTEEIETSVTDAGNGTRNVYQVPTIVSGWQNNGVPANPVGFSKDSNGYVHLRGAVITTLNPPSTPVTLFTIPEGFRPPNEVWFTTYGLRGVTPFTAYIRITNLGTVVLQSGATTLYDIVSLENISFYASETW